MKHQRQVNKRKRAARPGRNVWAVRRGTRFSIKEEGASPFLIPPVPQSTAIAIGRVLARANKSELVVQSRDGRIRLRDSHGHDPFPTRG